MAENIAIPLITAFAPSIVDLIASLTHRSAIVAEQNLGSGTNVAKFGQVFANVMTALTTAAAAGQIPKELPPDGIVQVIIQAVVTSMKLGNLLNAPPLPIPPGGQTITLSAGQSLSVIAK